jgi:ABC-type Fe3+ transport system permease subunit
MHPIAFIGIGDTEAFLVFGVLLFVLPLWIVPAILSFFALDRIPREDRKQDPALALLLLIPLFSLIWAFFVYPRISASLESYFSRKGDHSNGDCGRSLGIMTCIFSLIPFVHIVALVCMIIFFVKVFTLTGKIERGSGPAPIAA